MPYEVDLAKSSGKNGEDRIVTYESAERLGINPERYL